MFFTSLAYANSGDEQIGPLPVVQNASSILKKSLGTLKERIESDATNCLENAKGMGYSGKYNASVRKMVDTSKIVALEVSGSMICDGIHSSSYQYGIAFEKTTGRRFDLNRIYNIAIKQDGHLFLRAELGGLAQESYQQANKNNRSCLAGADWKGELTNIPITFSPQLDGSIVLYYAAPDVSAACFPALRLPAGAISEFRDNRQASQYDLP